MKDSRSGVLAWFATNHVAVNLLMFLLLGAGALSLMSAVFEVFPEFDADVITVTVPYRGATPAEAEEGVNVRVEEAVASIEGIKRLKSAAQEGVGTITIELDEDVDDQEVLDDVKAAVDRIETFPAETEKPIVALRDTRREVITVVLYGKTTEKVLNALAERVRDELTILPEISQVEVAGVRAYEISIEVSEASLRRYNLSFSEVAEAVRRSSLDLPGAADRLARDRYQRGLANLLTVLETERRLRAAEEANMRIRAEVWNTRIDLFLALGGDWSADDPVDDVRQENTNVASSTDDLEVVSGEPSPTEARPEASLRRSPAS